MNRRTFLKRAAGVLAAVPLAALLPREARAAMPEATRHDVDDCPIDDIEGCPHCESSGHWGFGDSIVEGVYPGSYLSGSLGKELPLYVQDAGDAVVEGGVDLTTPEDLLPTVWGSDSEFALHLKGIQARLTELDVPSDGFTHRLRVASTQGGSDFHVIVTNASPSTTIRFR
jgi:hypothetical protein